jgi:hypothetical protein
MISQTSAKPLKIIIIRHGEKPKVGDNLNCKGLNRSLLLPSVIVSKFGVPAFTYVPSLGTDSSTKHSRMFQTVTPLAVRYNLTVNSKFHGKDSSGLAADILKRNGVVLVVWNHDYIIQILHALGVMYTGPVWDDNDFDSIWMINFKNGIAVLSKDKEGLKPAENCK